MGFGLTADDRLLEVLTVSSIWSHDVACKILPASQHATHYLGAFPFLIPESSHMPFGKPTPTDSQEMRIFCLADVMLVGLPYVTTF